MARIIRRDLSYTNVKIRRAGALVAIVGIARTVLAAAAVAINPRRVKPLPILNLILIAIHS